MSKDETITLRVSGETKRNFEKIASAHGLNLTEFIITMISEGATAERQRRERLRQNVQDYVNRI
jgi:uncharacterized protein (DUF1778 family)